MNVQSKPILSTNFCLQQVCFPKFCIYLLHRRFIQQNQFKPCANGFQVLLVRMSLIGGFEFSHIPLASYEMSLVMAHCERYRIVQLLIYDRNGIVRISRRGKSSVYTYRNVIFCNMSCDWRIENSLHSSHIYVHILYQYNVSL